jgi:hypothetical protein
MNNKRFSDIYGAVQSETRDTSSSFQTIAKRYCNDGYEEILRRLIQSNVVEQNRTFSLTTVAGTRSYTAPYDMGEVVYCLDTTNGKEVSVGNENDIYSKYPTAINTTGVPFLIVPRADSNLRVQPLVPNTIRIGSDSASDTTQSVFLRGISGSAEFYESVGLSGTTTATSVNSYDYLLEAIKSASTVGKVTITYITDATIASLISPESFFERYKVLEFYYVPAGSYTYTIRYRRQIKPMSQDNDIPIVDVAQGIEFFGIARAWEYKRQLATATYFMNKFETWYTNYVTDLGKNQVQQFDIMPYSRNY